MESDYRYYSRRAAEESQRAGRAVTPAARARHLELADLFSKRAEQRAIHNVMARIKTMSPRPRLLVGAED